MRAYCGSMVVIGLLWGCGSDAASSPADKQDAGANAADAAADRTLDDGGREPMLPGTLARDGTVRSASEQLDRLRDANQVLSLFVKQDPTLSLSGSACDNANNVAARASEAVSQANTSCTKAKASCESGTGSVSATFTSCAVGDTGSTVSGTASATVSKASANGATTITVAVTLSDVSVATTDGSHTLKGKISTSTSDLKTYAVTADLNVDAYAITFKGTTKAAESAEGDLEGVTLDGTGTVSGPSMTEMMGSSTCTSSSLAYTAAGLHRSFAQCRADAGTATLTQSYACSTTTTVRGKPRTTMTTASVSDVVTWNNDTPTTGNVQVATSTTLGGQTMKSEKEVTLPGECK